MKFFPQGDIPVGWQTRGSLRGGDRTGSEKRSTRYITNDLHARALHFPGEHDDQGLSCLELG